MNTNINEINELSNASDVYLNILTKKIKIPILQGFKSIYNVAKSNCKKRQREYEINREFQVLLKSILHWSDTTLNNATEEILKKVSDFKSLMTAIFVAKAEILSKIKITENKNKIKIEIPTVSRFIHQIYIKSAENFYYSTELFDEDIDPVYRKSNIKRIYKNISESVYDTVNDMIPYKNILHDNIGEYFEDSGSDSDNNFPQHSQPKQSQSHPQVNFPTDIHDKKKIKNTFGVNLAHKKSADTESEADDNDNDNFSSSDSDSDNDTESDSESEADAADEKPHSSEFNNDKTDEGAFGAVSNKAFGAVSNNKAFGAEKNKDNNFMIQPEEDSDDDNNTDNEKDNGTDDEEDEADDDKKPETNNFLQQPQPSFQNSTTDLFKKYNNFGFNQFKNRDK